MDLLLFVLEDISLLKCTGQLDVPYCPVHLYYTIEQEIVKYALEQIAESFLQLLLLLLLSFFRYIPYIEIDMWPDSVVNPLPE